MFIRSSSQEHTPPQAIPLEYIYSNPNRRSMPLPAHLLYATPPVQVSATNASLWENPPMQKRFRCNAKLRFLGMRESVVLQNG
jgi:hypothetical protein